MPFTRQIYYPAWSGGSPHSKAQRFVSGFIMAKVLHEYGFFTTKAGEQEFTSMCKGLV
jgi:hypothetical protein